MSDRRTLRVFDKLLAARERASTSLALPIVHDALGPEEDVLQAMASAFDGTYIPAQGRPAGAEGPLNRALARVARTSFERERLPLTIEESNGRIVASFDDHPSPTGGLETALRLVEVLVSGEIDRDLAIVSYPLSGLDSAVAGVLWELCGLAVLNNPPSSLRLFAPIAIGEVDVDRHCLPNNPVRLAVQQKRLIQRGDAHDLEDALRTLLLNRNQPIVLFLGAGASASAGIRMGDSIRDEALQHLVGPHPTPERRVEAFREYLESKGRWRIGERDLPVSQFASQLTLERVLREAFHRLGGRSRDLLPIIDRLKRECATALNRTPPGRRALWSMIDKLPRLVVATVNFDQLVEVGLAAPHETIVTPDKFEQNIGLITDRVCGRTDTLPILKLHGSIEDSQTLVVDIDTTELGLPPKITSALDSLVDTVDGALTWVWIGCSMRDADLRLWLGTKGAVEDLHEWWVDPLPSESLFAYARAVREAQWAGKDPRLRDRLVTETSDVFLERLDHHIDTLP